MLLDGMCAGKVCARFSPVCSCLPNWHTEMTACTSKSCALGLALLGGHRLRAGHMPVDCHNSDTSHSTCLQGPQTAAPQLQLQPTGCDSSDCRVCQGSSLQGPFGPGKLSSLSGKKRSGLLHTTNADQLWPLPAASCDVDDGASTSVSSSGSAEPCSLTASDLQPATDARMSLASGKRSRLARTTSEPVEPAALAEVLAGGDCSSFGEVHLAGEFEAASVVTNTTNRDPRWQGGWCWEAEFEDRIAPAPAALHDLEWITPSSSGHGPGAELICALEFSEDGLFLASAGVGKQVRQ